jgi:hypothetical protein
MKKLSQILLILIAGIFTSCNEETFPCCPPINSDMVNTTVLNAQGNNLLNPTLEGSYRANVIKIFYEEEGKLEEFFNGGHSNMRRNFRIISPELGSDYLMSLVLKEKTVIQWNETQADTLKAEIFDDGMRLILRKVYHNGELKWDRETLKTGEGGITIIK